MNACVFIWTVYFVVLIQSEACDKKELRGNIKNCLNKGSDANVLQETVANGTSCLVETDLGYQVWECDGDTWNGMIGATELKIIHKRGFFGGLACVLTFFSCLWSGRSGPAPDKTPPTLNCLPLIETGIAEPFQTYSKVNWKYPNAYDAEDGSVSVIRTSGRDSGRHFPEGNTSVNFYAKDKSGNKAQCRKTIQVTVTRCSQPSPVNNGYFICHPSTDFVRGGWCRFGCYDGFDLQGESTIICMDNGKWTAAQPTCKAWTCPFPTIINGADIPTCTDNVRYRSICTYDCKTGYDMPANVSKTIVCSISKRWRQFGTPKCIDVESPKFEHCPNTKVFGTDRGVNTSQVNWKVPVVRDNSGLQITPELTSGFPSNSKLPAGTYRIVYAASDEAGNYAKPCSFKVVVRDIRCHKLYPTPYVRMQCPDGYRTGAGCNISCDPGKIRKGSDFVTCEESMNRLYGKWNWKSGQQTTCISTHHCSSLAAPTNGAVACDNWSGGQFCQLQCRAGTQMSGVTWRTLFVCNNNGDWFPTPIIRPCTETRHPQPAVGINVNFYFYGDCTDEETKENIAANFIAALNSSLIRQESCGDSEECVKDNVMVTCGMTERSKREILEHNKKNPMNLTIHITLPLSTPLYNINEYDQTSNEVQKLLYITTSLCNSNSTLIFGETPVELHEVANLGLDVLCREGNVKVKNSLSCVECPTGTSYRRDTQECDSCAKGTYQDRSGQSTCNRCPYRTTTRYDGATSVSDCEDACPPGTFSIDGIQPCSPCEYGEYQPSFGRQKCHKCHGSTTTQATGAVQRSECNEFDIELPQIDNKTAIVTLQGPKTFTNFILTFWVRRENKIINSTNQGIDIALINGEAIVWHLKNGHIFRQSRSESNFEIPLPDNRWHNVRIESRKCHLTGFTDGIPVVEMSATGKCSQITFNKIILSAGADFGGGISQLNIWNETSYISSPFRCFHNGKAALVSWQEFGDAELKAAYINLPSSCDDHDNCVSSPCHHGKCTDALHGYYCDCNNGFTGQQCDVNIDDCQTNICMNNATCVDGTNTYKCACSDSFTGTYCEILIVHGQWSDWSNWTECTTICGQGSQSRKRLCNSPNPDNGGRNCTGKNTEFVICINAECPVCPSIEAPGNGSLECNNDNEAVTCTLSCNDGFDFDTRPLDTYTCGPDTFYEWNFQTEENPERHLPKCTAIQMPEKLTVHYSAKYRNLYCSSEELSKTAKNRIYTRIKATLNSLPCVARSTCSLDSLEITDCSASKQQRRSVTTAGVSLEISIQPDNDHANKSLQDIQDAFKQLQSSAENGSLTVAVFDDEYEIDVDSTFLSGKAKCKPGTTRVKHYCVPCGVGSYSFEDYCKPCAPGSYQNGEGQLSCIPCPEGKKTLGIGASGTRDCTVEVPSVPVGIKVTAIAVGAASAGFVVILLIFAYRRYRSVQQRKIAAITDINLPVRGNHVDHLGPAKIKFINKPQEHIKCEL